MNAKSTQWNGTGFGLSGAPNGLVVGMAIALLTQVCLAKEPSHGAQGRVAPEEDVGNEDEDVIVGAGADLDTGEGPLPDKIEVAERRAEMKDAAESVTGSGKGDERMRAAFNQVVIKNRHSYTVYYQLRVGNGSWSNFSLRPNYYYTHTVSSNPSVRFDWSFAGGVQNRQYTLTRGTDNEFRRTSNGAGIDLYRTSGPVVPPPPTSCSNTCSYRNDGDCDDGGPGSDYSLCALGTDTADCGSRCSTVVIPPGPCINTCRWAFDGECDDGGPGSDYNLCPRGTDCGDCGVR